jgi:hypothetical protein
MLTEKGERANRQNELWPGSDRVFRGKHALGSIPIRLSRRERACFRGAKADIMTLREPTAAAIGCDLLLNHARTFGRETRCRSVGSSRGRSRLGTLNGLAQYRDGATWNSFAEEPFPFGELSVSSGSSAAGGAGAWDCKVGRGEERGPRRNCSRNITFITSLERQILV